MDVSSIPNARYFSEDFVVSAGSVLFRTVQGDPATVKEEDNDFESGTRSSANGLEICILRYPLPGGKVEWLLPKGRKDVGETIEHAAVRETFEETGYACRLHPTTMITRAPLPDPEQVIGEQHDPHSVEKATEPIAVQMRPTGTEGRVVKLIWWFVTWALDPSATKHVGSQIDYETFESRWVDADEATLKLTYEADRSIAEKALLLVRQSSS